MSGSYQKLNMLKAYLNPLMLLLHINIKTASKDLNLNGSIKVVVGFVYAWKSLATYYSPTQQWLTCSFTHTHTHLSIYIYICEYNIESLFDTCV